MDCKELSIVIPVYKCGNLLNVLCERLEAVLEQMGVSHEIILVNDGSPDNAWDIIRRLCKKSLSIRGIDLSRNFGQHAAIAAGLEHSSGKWVVVMDGDLQDQPEEIPKLYRVAQEGYEVVLGRRCERKDKKTKVLISLAYRKIFDFWSGANSDPATANYGIYHRRAIDAFLSMPEQSRTLKLFILWLGFKTTAVDIEHAERPEGKTSYSFRKSLTLALTTITTHSNRPLQVSVFIGFLMSFLSMLHACYLVFRYCVWGVTVPGWTSVIVSVYFVGGMILANLGVLGVYLGKLYDEAKRRPMFVVRRTSWDLDDSVDLGSRPPG